MKILLAGPGTGKTTKIRKLLSDVPDSSRALVLSFTNATVNDLLAELSDAGLGPNNCMTLHKFAVKYNHDHTRHVLHPHEIDRLETITKGAQVSFASLCDFLMCTTFDQMIERFVSFARANDAYLKEMLFDFDVLIVDEYQDFNPNEQALIDLLVPYLGEVYILGDDDQCIYDFKDASADRIIELHHSFEAIEHEHICYRCPDDVVEYATRLIERNKRRVPKAWQKSTKPGTVAYQQFLDQERLVGSVVQKIQRVQATEPGATILVLSPVEFMATPIIDGLASAGIQFDNFFSPGHPFELVKAAWKLRFLFGERRYLNLVLLGYDFVLPRKHLYKLIGDQYRGGQNLDQLVKLVEKKLPREMLEQYSSIDAALATDAFTDLSDLYAAADGDDVNSKLENMLRADPFLGVHPLKVMTIHKSKGLGADHVFMVGLVEGILPNGGRGDDSIESQRRLFYVGMTRAKKALHLLAAVRIEGKFVHRVNKPDFKYDYRSKLYQGRASRFIEELNLDRK